MIRVHRIAQQRQSDKVLNTKISEAAEIMQVAIHMAWARIQIQCPMTQDTVVYLTPMLTVNCVVLCTAIDRSV